ncbi:9464_t:CDS:2 [Funneliformis geosporum]|nr:9464_t:CDS:2 [Funneliformis geosporum]
MLIQKDKFDNLTSNYSYEKGKIEQYIQEAESNRNYIRSKYQIEQEKFKGVIAVYPKIDEEQRVIPVGEKYNNDEETERKKITVKGYNEKG